MGDEKNLKCEIHDDQFMFDHWERYYCPQCKKWYNKKD